MTGSTALKILASALLVTAGAFLWTEAFWQGGVVEAQLSKTESAASSNIPEASLVQGEFDGSRIVRTDAEWKRVLTPAEYYILREEGTEKPYTGALLKNKKKGTYHCAACGLEVFRSNAKYDSQTGWPSFFKPAYKKNVTEKADRTLGEERVEIECSRCQSHLGHVFDDGPPPTGLRYCINSIALRFKPAK